MFAVLALATVIIVAAIVANFVVTLGLIEFGRKFVKLQLVARSFELTTKSE